MTERTVIECDGPDTDSCSETAPAGPPTADPPTDWSTFETPDGDELHFCGTCTRLVRGLLTDGKSVGPKLKVSHDYRGQEFEQAYVDAGTHGITIQQVIDEPTRRFPDYDHNADEAWCIGVFDHLHVYIFGAHKDEPLVVVDADEWPTAVTITDLEDSFELEDPVPEDFHIRTLPELREARDVQEAGDE